MVSFIIPAHNEEKYIGPTVRAVMTSAEAVREPFEVIVVDDASTDRTASIAREHGAQVVTVQNRQIAATRALAWHAGRSCSLSTPIHWPIRERFEPGCVPFGMGLSPGAVFRGSTVPYRSEGR